MAGNQMQIRFETAIQILRRSFLAPEPIASQISVPCQFLGAVVYPDRQLLPSPISESSADHDVYRHPP
jgi:hypothetical protein